MEQSDANSTLSFTYSASTIRTLSVYCDLTMGENLSSPISLHHAAMQNIHVHWPLDKLNVACHHCRKRFSWLEQVS